MSDQPPRIVPLQAPYAPSIEVMLAKWMPPESPLEPLRLFRTLARATVPPALREVMIHRTCALTGAQYEWGVHAVAFGKPLGLSDTQLHSTVHGEWSDDCWDAEQASVFRLAQELHETSTISDDLWEVLAARFQEPQILELIVTAGWYHVIGYVCNGLRVQPEEWALPFPQAS
jgi:alkylhydroperoxidase family enzyme